MANSALGAALTIPQSALDAIEQADKKLKDIQDTAKNTAASVTKSFDNMAIGTKPFLDTLDQVINKLNIVGTSATNASGGLNNIGASAGTMSGNITQASVNVQNMVAQLSKMNGSGTSGIMQAVLAFQRLQEATKGTSGMNIAELKQEIGAIDSMLKDVDYNLTKTDQDALIKRKKMLQDELKYQQQMYEERAVAFQKALDKMASAEQSYNNKQKRLYTDRAKSYQNENYKSNTSYQGALNFSATANTLNRQVRAIEYLKEARMKLSTADTDYKHKLETLNAAIAEHNKKLKETGINTKQLGEQTSYMAGYLSRWAQRMAFAFSINSIKGFVDQLTEVRGQFELSQRSLEAILQNKPKADEIFNKTVELAVKSPFRIKDLVDYTRQLSAYRIESNKLYDTTKRLADVSAGLGVDMGRLILAYGQVKAAAYLRGSEVRQFTEAGINMYGELQQYFKEVKGEAYTTAQIVDMISKRKVTFQDVEAIFQRMTDKGGTFYNMQEIQAETLQGKISNLKDAFDVMLNDIGKRWEGLLKNSISFATSMLKYWELIGDAISTVVIAFATYKALSLTSSNIIKNMIGNWKALRAIIASTEGVMNKVKSAAILFSGTIKVLKSVLAGIAITALYDLGIKIYESFDNYNKAIEESNKNTAKLRGNINAISRAYDDLSESAKTANKEQKKADSSILTKKRTELQALVDEANKNGYTITIDVKAIADSEIDKTFETLKTKYQNFVTFIQITNERLAQSEKFDWLPGQNSFKDVVNSYNEAATDVMSHTNKIDEAVNIVKENYDKATESTKKWFDAIMQGRKDGESDLSYYQRMASAITHINFSMQNPSWLKPTMDGISSLIKSFGRMKDAEKDVQFYFKEVFGDAEEFKEKYGNDPQVIKFAIDKTAADRGWGDFVQEMLYKTANTIFHVKIKEDKVNIEETAITIHDQLQKELDKRKVNIKVESLYNSPLHSYVEDAENLNKALQDYQDDLKYMAKHPKKYYLASELMKQGMDLSGVKNKKGKPITGNDYIDPGRVKAYILKQIAELQRLGAHSKTDDKNAKDSNKVQRDILQERISLLKDMNAKYDELIKFESKEQALTDTRKYFKEAAQNVGWNANDILPDDASVIKRIREIGAKFKELTKRGNAFRIAADISVNMNKEEVDKIREDISRNVDEAFSSLNLYKKLKGENLTDDIIKNLFGDLPTSFEDVEKKMNQEFNKYTTAAYEKEYGTDHTKWDDKVIQEYNSKLEHTEQAMAKLGKKQNKEYQDAKKKLNEQVYQDQVNQAQELIKAYKQQLSDQLQLDKWYIEELQKIQNNANLAKNPELQKQLQDNLDTQYKKKTGENTWKNFQGSDMYVKIFENLDHTSTKVLDYMIQKLQSLKSEMKDLDPTQVKAIAEQIEKLQAQKNSRNPFKAFTTGLKELIEYTKEYKKLGGDNALISTSDKYDKEEKEIENQNKLIANLNAEYEKSKSVNGLDNDKTKTLETNLNLSKRQLKSLEKQHNETKDTLDTLNKAQGKTDQAKNKFSQSVQDITSIVSSMTTAFRGLFEALGGSDEGLEETLNIVDNIGQAVGSYYSGNYAGVVSGAMGAITGAIKLFNTKDKKLQREIERHQKVVDKLKEAYDDLKEAMDNAYDIAKLSKYSDEMIKNLELQNQNLQSMIAAERDKKDTDDSKIEEWQKQIEANNKAIKEAEETLTEQLGGFGTKANYKSAAEAFADVWMDAYNENSDGLEALNDKFNEYFNNLLKKQLMARAASKFIQPILDAVDAAVAKGSEGGNDGLEVTSGELKKLQELKNTNLQAFNEYANTLMKVLGVTSKGASNLSNLQQGIQSVSEATAQALESLLNSYRWYIAQQQQDIRFIRTILEEQLGNIMSQATNGGSSNQMITLMEQQNGYLRQICDNWSSVTKAGHRQGGKGLKVFMS